MTNDYRGNGVAVGVKYVPLATLRNDDGTNGPILDEGPRSRPRAIPGAQLVPIGALVDTLDARLPTIELRRWMGRQPAVWWASPFAGIGQIGSGTGNSYVASPEYHPIVRNLRTNAAFVVDVGNGTSGTNCRTVYGSNAVSYLGEGFLYWFRMSVDFMANLQTARFGLWGGGNGTTPPAGGGRPAKGVWLEWDRAIHATKIRLCAADGGTVSTSDVGIDLANNDPLDWFVGISGGKAKAWEITADENPLTNVASNLPSTENAKAARMFFQAQKLTTSPSSSVGYLYCLNMLPLGDPASLYPNIPQP